MKSAYLFFTLSILMVTSCTVTSRLKTSEKYVNRQAEASGSDARLINKPILADLEVSMQRAQTNFSITNKEIGSSSIVLPNQGKSQSGGRAISTIEEYYKNEAKKRAQFQFMSEHKCDYLVDPIYKIDTESKSTSDTMRIKVEIFAFPAVYKKFSQPDSLPKCLTQINYMDHRGVPLYIGSDEESTFVGKARGIVTNLGATRVNLDDNYSGGFGGSFGYFSKKALNEKVSIRNEANFVTRSLSYFDEFQDSYFNYDPNGNPQPIGFNTIRSEYSKRYYGIQVPLLLSIDGKRIGVYMGPAFNLDLYYTSRNRIEGSTSWEGRTASGVANGGVSVMWGANIHVKDNFSIGYRHDIGLGYWNWRSNSLCMSFKLN
jgi:hypothetical protein